MLLNAAHVAAQPNSSLNAPRAAFRDRLTQRYWRSKQSSCGLYVIETSAAVVVFLHARNWLGDFGALEFLPSRIPSSTRVHASGLSCALRQARSSASATRPFGLRFPSPTDPP
jgi:hypothetical protein